ncbi:MAG: UbiA prenyltransferase family protein [Actinomycetota bacterium]|nr:UbiA prenyltransferase family protein [Actinomycetota bacterium]
MALPARAEIVELPERRSPVRAAVAALRPRQWSKNLLLFAGLLFAAKLGDATRWLEAAAAFAAYCAASSAAYLVNDVRDAEHDRTHPLKRLRPIAHRELSPSAALALSAVLVLLAAGLVSPLGVASLGFLSAFLILQGAYSLGLKHVVLLDVFVIAALFVVRSAAGADAVAVRISPWLLLVTALLALFLALAKRRSELVLPGSSRPVLDGYSLALVDQLIAVTVACTIGAYAIYTFTAHSPALMATIPFVVFGVFRYLLLVHRDDLGEEPENVLLTDRPLVLAVVLWAVTAAVILAATN